MLFYWRKARRLEECTKHTSGCLEQVVRGESSADHLSVTSNMLAVTNKLFSIGDGLFDGRLVIVVTMLLALNDSLQTIHKHSTINVKI
jgi:hypothetical protein